MRNLKICLKNYFLYIIVLGDWYDTERTFLFWRCSRTWRKYCKNIDAIYQLTSAQTGEGVNELFNKIGKELLIPRNLEQFKKFNEKKKEFDNSKNAVYAINNTNNNNRRKKGCC